VYGTEKFIIDADANIGAFSTYAFFKCNPTTKIFALEPVKDTYERLEKTINDNHLENGIATRNYGVGSISQEKAIFISSVGTYSSSYFKASENTEVIIIHNLKEVLNDIQAPDTVDLLKMDCEGAEMEALLGAEIETLRRFHRIALEYHEFAGFKITDVSNHLSRAGFREEKNIFFPLYKSGPAEYIRF
jgi:FkbM family methyltransferase